MDEYYKHRHLDRLAEQRHNLFMRWAEQPHWARGAMWALSVMTRQVEDMVFDLSRRLPYHTFTVR